MTNEKELLDTTHKYKMEEIKSEQDLIKDNINLKHQAHMKEQTHQRDLEQLKHENELTRVRIISAEKRKSIERRTLREEQRQFAGTMAHQPGRPPE